MKAVMYEGIGKISIRDVEKPKIGEDLTLPQVNRKEMKRRKRD